MQVKRTKIYKVRLSEDEVIRLKDEAQVLQIAKFLRDSAFKELDYRKAKHEVYYSKLDREFLLELSRIGGNINQVAKAINFALARLEPLDKAKLMHLLISINGTLESLREDLR